MSEEKSEKTEGSYISVLENNGVSACAIHLPKARVHNKIELMENIMHRRSELKGLHAETNRLLVQQVTD